MPLTPEQEAFYELLVSGEAKQLREDLTRAIKTSKETGQRIRKFIPRDAFLAAFPDMQHDPRMGLTGEKFFLDVTPLRELPVSELLDLCIAAGHEHPLARAKAESVRGFGPDQLINVLREELDILKAASQEKSKQEKEKSKEEKEKSKVKDQELQQDEENPTTNKE